MENVEESENMYSLYGMNDWKNTVAHPTSNLWRESIFCCHSGLEKPHQFISGNYITVNWQQFIYEMNKTGEQI